MWHPGSSFLAGGAEGHGEVSPGDYLQTGYRLWLVGHQLEHGRAPWRDPYSFRPESGSGLNPGGWPFGLPYWALWRALGTVLAWNAFVLLGFVAAGAAALLWLRELGLPAGAALAGGLAFEIAPYRAAQSTGHLLGPVSICLPLALWAFERGRRGSWWWFAASGLVLASIPLSGQVHLALGATPFFLLYALCRTRARRAVAAAVASTLAAVGAGLAVRYGVIGGTLEAGGRSLGEVAFYSAEPADFVARHKRHGSESFVFLGWATPLAAIAGLALLVRARRRALAAALGIGALVPILLALGTHLPLYSALWHVLPPFRYPRVPERLMPIACLALAALVSVAAAELGGLGETAAEPSDRAARPDAASSVAPISGRYGRGVGGPSSQRKPKASAGLATSIAPRQRAPFRQALLARRRGLPVVVLVLALLFVDLHATIFGRSAADEGNRAYAAVRGAAPGRLLELPVFLPGIHFGSAYLYYDQQVRRERPGGYSTLAPVAADVTARALRPLNCGDWTGGRDRLVRSLGITAIAFHEGLYTENPDVPNRSWFAWRALLAHGFRPLATDGPVTAFARGASARRAVPPMREPAHALAHFCEGWSQPRDGERQMTDGHAPLWVYGTRVRLVLRASPPLDVGLSVDGRSRWSGRIRAPQSVTVGLGRPAWHLVAFDAHLPKVGGRVAGPYLARPKPS